MKISMTAALPLVHGTTKAQIVAWLQKVPDEAKLSVNVSKGDRPWESDQATIHANWEEEV